MINETLMYAIQAVIDWDVAKSSWTGPQLSDLVSALWDLDTAHYRSYGNPVTGGRYENTPFGPVPEDFNESLDELLRRGYVAWTTFLRNNLVNRSTFTSPHVLDSSWIDYSVGQWGADKRPCVEYMESLVPRVVSLGGEIPYGITWLVSDPPSPADLAWAREVAVREGFLQDNKVVPSVE